MAVEFSMLQQRPRKVPPFPQTNTTIDATAKYRKQSVPPTSDRIDRTSFSSIKESNSGGAQSFTDSKTSSYLRHEYILSHDEDAIDDAESGSTTPNQQKRGEMVEMLNPHSTLHGLVCPCDGFKGWKSISVGGKIASRSFGDLTKLRMRWDWDTTVKKEDIMELNGAEEKSVLEVGKYPAGRSPFEMLPMELLGKPTELSYSHTSKIVSCKLFFRLERERRFVRSTAQKSLRPRDLALFSGRQSSLLRTLTDFD